MMTRRKFIKKTFFVPFTTKKLKNTLKISPENKNANLCKFLSHNMKVFSFQFYNFIFFYIFFFYFCYQAKFVYVVSDCTFSIFICKLFNFLEHYPHKPT